MRGYMEMVIENFKTLYHKFPGRSEENIKKP
jgi:hypothetical protein